MTPFLFAALLVAGAGVAYGLMQGRKPSARPDPSTLIRTPFVEVLLVRHRDGAQAGTIEIRLHERGSGEVFGGLTPDTIDRTQRLTRFADTDHFTFAALPDQRYFALVFVDGRTRIVGEREIPMPGTVNLREIGGYRTHDGRFVRWGRMFRSGAVTGHMQADTKPLEALGLKLVCDLRLPEEAAETPDRLPDSPRPRYLHLPINTEMDSRERVTAILFNRRRLDQMMIQGYTEVMIDRNAKRFGEVLRHMADRENLPTLVHCTAGKDRTGVTTALLLLLLGVPDEVVIADYTLSNVHYGHYRDIAAKAIQPLRWMRVSPDDLYPLLVSRAETLQTTIAHIRSRYGSVEQYLLNEAELRPEHLAQIRDNFLE